MKPKADQLKQLRKILSKRPLVSTAELIEAGVSRYAFNELIESKDLIRACDGYVATHDAYFHPDFEDALACHVTGGIISKRTAGMRHGLTDALPSSIEVLVPYEKTRAPASLNLTLWRSRQAESFTEGVEERSAFGTKIRMTTPARTVVDLWRDRTADMGDRQHQLTALRTFLSENGDVTELRRIADVFGVRHHLDPRIEATFEAFRGVPTP